MRSALLHEVDGLRTFAVVMEKGDEAAGALSAFAHDHHLTGAGLTAVGAFREATLAYFDPESMSYEEIPVREQVELVSLVGDIALRDGEPALHAHVVLGPPRRLHRRRPPAACRSLAHPRGRRHRDPGAPAQAGRRRDRARAHRPRRRRLSASRSHL